jgi:hypothetical protein
VHIVIAGYVGLNCRRLTIEITVNPRRTFGFRLLATCNAIVEQRVLYIFLPRGLFRSTGADTTGDGQLGAASIPKQRSRASLFGGTRGKRLAKLITITGIIRDLHG